MVLVLGCFVTVRSTADWARSLATPSLGDWLPIFMSATSARVTTLSPFFFTMHVPSFSTSLVEVMPRMMYSLPYLYCTPPLVLVFMPRVHAMMSVSDTPKCFMRPGLTSI